MNHHALTALAALAAFALLALAMERHQQGVFGHELPAPRTRLLRTGGWLLLAVSLATAVAAQGWAPGLVAWCGHMTLGAAITTAALIVWDRHKAAKK